MFNLYLKGLDIKGFKSFADKIELEFKNGITGIVGPNGSGKSNIADAVRWVLGEQSAKTLRGGKMEDVIFAGTENRKPLGLAEVSLTIDNSDKVLPIEYSEVTVTRRLYRSGESEYLINNIPYRLKDISELFMDTGIGKDGYSLIGQGKIDEILSTKSEDRRNLFEEAAGIVKYRTRKQEAEKKLENTEQNMVRIEDIINELQEQIEPLGKQSETAKRYLALREELKELEVNIILNNYDNNKIKLDKIAFDITELTENSKLNEEERAKIHIRNRELKEILEKIEIEYREATDIRLETEKNHENKQGNLQLLNERQENLNKEVDRIKGEIADEENILTSLDQKVSKKAEDKALTESEISKQNMILESINNEYEITNKNCNDYEQQIENSKTDLIQLIKENSDLNNKINSSQINLQNIENRKNQINREIENKRLKINGLGEAITVNNKIIENARCNSETIKQELLRIDNNIKKLENEQDILKTNRNNTFDRVKTIEAKYNALNSMEHDMEGFNRAVKAVINKYKDTDTVFGTVSDLMKVKKGFEVAIETALGAGIQNVVVDNEDTASELIDYLKRNNLGRATFLPLTTIKGRSASISKEAEQIKGYLGIAANIVEYDEKYRAAITNLLGRIIICEDLNSAKFIARKTDYNYRIVTLDGDVVNSGGSFTGGSTNLKNIGIFSRKNEIEELNTVLQSEKLKLGSLEGEIIDNNKAVSENRVDHDKFNKELQQITIEYNNEISKLNGLLKEKSELETSISDVCIELKQLAMEYDRNQEVIRSNKEYIELVDLKQREIEVNVDEIQILYKDFVLKKEECWNRITTEKIVLAEKSKTLESICENIKQLEQEKKGQHTKIQANHQLIEENKNKIDIEKELIEKNYKEIVVISEEIIRVRHRISELEFKKQELTGMLNENEKEASRYEEVITDLTTAIHKLEVSKSKLETESEAVINKLWDDYEMTIPDADKFRTEINSITDANRKLNELKAAIRNLGDININAIEEYKRVKERYEFLTNQMEDLIRAQESLIEVIEEMTNKMTKNFIEKFNIIRENFNYTFKELFGGGVADLKLEGEDVLNSGIEIIVQPPGKKLQALSLLSGGERGLAAIALLFAILKMKPTPFCVLDEIEAALDDANVNRYAGFLRKYSNDTQFITITHRKGSMAVADALYGVTMEEKGVSKMLSLKLNGGK